MGKPQLDAQARSGVLVPQGLPGSCSQSPRFQKACRYPCGFVSTWSGSHIPVLMLACATGLLTHRAEPCDLCYSVHANSTGPSVSGALSALRKLSHTAFLQKQWQRKLELFFAFRNLQLHHVVHLPLKIQHHLLKQLLLCLEKLENEQTALCQKNFGAF